MTPSPSAIQPGTSSQNSTPPDDFFVPAYRISINEKVKQFVEQDVLSVTYHDSLTDIESMDLVVNNWDPGDPVPGQAVQGKFRYHNEDVFDPWQAISLEMGYYRNGKDNLQPMMAGSICSLAPNFPASGGSTLTVRALGMLHQFRFEQQTLQFPNMTDSEIAKKIVDNINESAHKKKLDNIKIQMSEEDLKANKPNEKPNPYLEMHGQYPIVFLMQRAREIGYDITIDKPVKAGKDGKTPKIRLVTFRYRPSSQQRPAYVLEWGKSLISFQPTLQTARQVNAVTVNGWDVNGKKPISVTVTRADLPRDRVIAPEDLGIAETQLAQKIEVVVDRAYKNEEDAKNAGKKALLNLSKELVTGKGKTIGLPDLRAGSKVRICMNPLDVDPNREKLVDRFSGIYEVTETTHTINESGYTTDFSCRLETKKKQ